MVPVVSPSFAASGDDPAFHEWESARKRQGRRFQPIAERELDPALRHLAARLPGAKGGVLAVTEMPSPSGIPDLVVVTRAVAAAHQRLTLGAPPLLISEDVRLVARCAVRATFTVPVLADRLHLDERTVHRRLNRLYRLGYVMPKGNGWVRRAEMLPIGRIYALEAKVEDWRSAFRQAMLYGSWADASAVVLLQLPRNADVVAHEARRLGLGLANGDRWVVRPRIHRHDSARRLLASEHVVAALQPHHAT